MDTLIHKTAQQEAYIYLRESILSGGLPGGKRVDIAYIAAKLGMSRMPVREALRQLASEGLVTIRPNRGAVVTQLSPDDVLEIFEMRSVLEGLAARVARPKLDAEAFEDLERLLERMDRYRHSPDQWIRVHNEFHDFICQRSERKRLAEQTLVMRRSVEVYYRVFIGAYHAVEIPGSEHADLLRMIRDGNAETAERAVREHIVSAAREIVGFLKASRPLGAADPAAVPPTARRSQGEGGA